MLEFGWNSQLMPELDPSGLFKFHYNNYDIEEDFRKNELYEKKLDYMTVNEIRELEDLAPIDGGDKLKSTVSSFGSSFGYNENNANTDTNNPNDNKDKVVDTKAKNSKIKESELEKKLVGFYSELEKKIKETAKEFD